MTSTATIPTAMSGVRTTSINPTLAAIASFGERDHDMTPATDAERDLLDLIPEGPADLRSTPQVELMNRLMAELRELDPAAAAQGDDYMHGMTMGGHWTAGRDGNASRWIDRLIAKLREVRAARKAAAPAAGQRVELADGVYRLNGQLYMVQHAVHGSGNQYAKRIVLEGNSVSAEYARGIISRLRPEMALTAEEAKAFGDVYGMCVFCLRDLTDERSKAVGYGRKCADNRGLPWG
jgi:hypothetical protein